ncbi:hypothetical protein BpHYR1_014646, partial [Brachionus plicatilis]
SAIDKEVFGMVQRKRRKTATAQLELNAVWCQCRFNLYCSSYYYYYYTKFRYQKIDL